MYEHWAGWDEGLNQDRRDEFERFISLLDGLTHDETEAIADILARMAARVAA